MDTQKQAHRICHLYDKVVLNDDDDDGKTSTTKLGLLSVYLWDLLTHELCGEGAPIAHCEEPPTKGARPPMAQRLSLISNVHTFPPDRVYDFKCILILLVTRGQGATTLSKWRASQHSGLRRKT